MKKTRSKREATGREGGDGTKKKTITIGSTDIKTSNTTDSP